MHAPNNMVDRPRARVALTLLLLASACTAEPATRSDEAPALTLNEANEPAPAAEPALPSSARSEHAPLDELDALGDESAAASPDLPADAALDAPAVEDKRDELDEFDAEGWRAREIKPGDRLATILQRLGGLSATETHALVTALTPHADPTRIRPGQRYRLQEIEGQLRAFELALGPTSSVRVERDGERWTAEVVLAATETRTIDAIGTITSSLSAAVNASGEHPALVARIVDAFAYDLNFYTDTRAGDVFKVVVERVELEGEFVRYDRLLAAEYRGHDGAHQMFLFQAPGSDSAGYFDKDGHGVTRTFLKSPLKYARISSGFNPKRMHPVLHRVKGHMGTDYAAPEGTPVWAAADGRITARSRRGGAGNMVVIRHADGLTTLYMHLSKFARGQRVGAQVKQKTVIGYVGSTGLATGPHLHFGVKKNGRYVDPQTVSNHRSGGVARKHRARYKRAITPLLRRLDGLTAQPEAAPEIVPETAPE